MAREYARVKVKIWADSDFRKLSGAAQHLYFVLLTSPTMSLCGVADWRPKRLAALVADATVTTIEAAAVELSERGYIVVDNDTEEVLVRSFIRHDGLIKTPNIASAMVKDYAGTASETLRGAIVFELNRLNADDPDMKGWIAAKVLLTKPSVNPSGIPSLKAYPIPSGNESHIPQPASRNQQPSSPQILSIADAPDEFAEFWALYPKKEAKGAASKAFKTAVKKAGLDKVIDGLKAQLPIFTKTERQFIPLPASWLNAERWADEVAPTTPERTQGWWNNQ